MPVTTVWAASYLRTGEWTHGHTPSPDHFVIRVNKRSFPLSLTCKQLYHIAEYERKRRQNMDNLLSIFVHGVDTFRLRMRKTGGIIIRVFESAFFTEANPRKEVGNVIQLFFHNFDFGYCRG
jgi:hypothetical protein